MLLFQLEDQVETWCRQSGEPRGVILPLTQVWELAQVWYGSRMNPDYQGRSAGEAEAIFAQLGLDASFWKF